MLKLAHPRTKNTVCFACGFNFPYISSYLFLSANVPVWRTEWVEVAQNFWSLGLVIFHCVGDSAISDQVDGESRFCKVQTLKSSKSSWDWTALEEMSYLCCLSHFTVSHGRLQYQRQPTDSSSPKSIHLSIYLFTSISQLLSISVF